VVGNHSTPTHHPKSKPKSKPETKVKIKVKVKIKIKVKVKTEKQKPDSDYYASKTRGQARPGQAMAQERKKATG
jgi:hypothetical protein